MTASTTTLSGSPGGGDELGGDGGFAIIRYGGEDADSTDRSTFEGMAGPSDEVWDGDWFGSAVLGPGDLTGDGLTR